MYEKLEQTLLITQPGSFMESISVCAGCDSEAETGGDER